MTKVKTMTCQNDYQKFLLKNRLNDVVIRNVNNELIYVSDAMKMYVDGVKKQPSYLDRMNDSAFEDIIGNE